MLGNFLTDTRRSNFHPPSSDTLSLPASEGEVTTLSTVR